MAGLPALDSAKLQILQELEVEMMSDMYNRMTNACHRKCIPPKYKEALLAKGEAVCIDRCVAKYLEVYERIGKKLTELSMQDDDMMKKLQTDQLNTNAVVKLNSEKSFMICRMSTLDNFIRENHVLLIIETATLNRESYLNLSNCEISQIPGQLITCKNLVKLYLNNNKLKNLPDEISNWENLRLLAVDYNFLSTIPPSIGRLQNLVCLNLSYNNLGRLIPEIGLLSKLEVLWLNHVHLESIPSEIGNCTELDTFGARGNFIRELPPEIGKLHRLRWMTLEGNLLSSLPEEIDGLHQLIHLNLSNNRFESMPKLHNLQELQYVFLSQNIITELDVAYAERLKFIKKINLHDNPLPTIFPYRHIKNLNFDDNIPIQDSQQEEESDSEEWEESAPSSELDMSDTSEEEIPLDILTALPKVAKFTATGY